MKFIANPECITALGYLCFRSGARAVSLHATAYAEISRVPLANTSFLALESLLVESKPSCILAINGLLLDLVQGVFAPPYTSTNSGSDVSECSDAESTTTHRQYIHLNIVIRNTVNLQNTLFCVLGHSLNIAKRKCISIGQSFFHHRIIFQIH